MANEHVLDEDSRADLNERMLATSAERVAKKLGISALTLAKAAAGLPIGGGTILDIHASLEEGANDDEDEDEDDEDEDGCDDDDDDEDEDDEDE